MIAIERTQRWAERRAEVLARLAPAGNAAARELGEELAQEAEGIARPRIRYGSPGGYLTKFRVSTAPHGTLTTLEVDNTAPSSKWVEIGREPGRPVMKPKKGGGSFIAYYTGAPPPGIFGDIGNDWPMRQAIARDGIPARGVFRDLRAANGGAELLGRFLGKLGPRIFNA